MHLGYLLIQLLASTLRVKVTQQLDLEVNKSLIIVLGICSSLLAVIEQLRERQAEDGKYLPRGKRRKRKKNAKVSSSFVRE